MIIDPVGNRMIGLNGFYLAIILYLQEIFGLDGLVCFEIDLDDAVVVGQ